MNNNKNNCSEHSAPKGKGKKTSEDPIASSTGENSGDGLNTIPPTLAVAQSAEDGTHTGALTPAEEEDLLMIDSDAESIGTVKSYGIAALMMELAPICEDKTPEGENGGVADPSMVPLPKLTKGQQRKVQRRRAKERRQKEAAGGGF